MLPFQSGEASKHASQDPSRHHRSSSSGNYLGLASLSRPYSSHSNPFLASPSGTQSVKLPRPKNVERQRSNSLPFSFNYAYIPQSVLQNNMSAEPVSFSPGSPSADHNAFLANRLHSPKHRDPFRPVAQRRRSQSLTSLSSPQLATKWDWNMPSLELASQGNHAVSPASTERFDRKYRQSLSSLNSPKHIVYDPGNLHSDDAMFEMALHTSTPELDYLREQLGIKRGQRPKMPSHAHPRMRSHCKPLIHRFEQLILLEATQMKMQQTITARNTAVNAANATGLPVKLPAEVSAHRDAREATPLRPVDDPAADFNHFNEMHQDSARVAIPGQRDTGLHG